MKAGRPALLIWLFTAVSANADINGCLDADAKNEAPKAISACSAAIAQGGLTDVELAAALHQRGVALRNTGDLPGSEKDLRQAIELALSLR